MTTKAADDYAAIAQRMKELANEEPVSNKVFSSTDVCEGCANIGWVMANTENGKHIWLLCPKCYNPHGLAAPASFPSAEAISRYVQRKVALAKADKQLPESTRGLLRRRV